ncbi:SDR family oxidoreductase [Nocardia asteroides NBRC 15531]|nr:SDR family oxidoreductase [Nocardia asteroides NBRC 15531]
MAAAVPVQPRRHDLRRFERSAAQHHRRACARPAARGSPVTGPLSVPPPSIPGHGLLTGRKAVITAAAGTGIGSSTARRLLEEGADVVVSDWHERRLTETAELLAKEFPERKVGAVVCDVRDTAQVNELLTAAAAELGRIDIMVNNAGLGGETPVVDMTDEQWDQVLDITLTGTFRCTRAALGYFRSAGHGGVIVNNASVLGWRAQHGQAHYAAAKAGVMALTRCSAVEAAEFGVRINAVAPSIARHPFLDKVSSTELLDALSEREAFGRAAEPWEVAATIAMLASDYTSYLTGEVVSVSSQRA